MGSPDSLNIARARNLPEKRLEPHGGVELFRIHSKSYGPVYFSNDDKGRFSPPAEAAGAYGTCHFGLTREVAFLESIFHSGSGYVSISPNMGIARVSEDVVDAHRISELEITSSIRIADLTDSKATGSMISNDCFAGDDYTATQGLGWAIYLAGFNGIRYKARQGVTEDQCLAIFGDPPNPNVKNPGATSDLVKAVPMRESQEIDYKLRKALREDYHIWIIPKGLF